MTDHFEEAKDKILKEARLNGGVTSDHLLDALIATNEDLDEKLEAQRLEAVTKHKETRQWHEDVLFVVEEHVKEAATRDERLDSLEGWRIVTEENCEGRIRQLCAEEHSKVHKAYVDTLDTKSFAQILTGWSWLKKGLAIAVIATITGVIGLGITYIGSYAANNKAEQVLIHDETTHTPVPIITITVTPTP